MPTHTPAPTRTCGRVQVLPGDWHSTSSGMLTKQDSREGEAGAKVDGPPRASVAGEDSVQGEGGDDDDEEEGGPANPFDLPESWGGRFFWVVGLPVAVAQQDHSIATRPALPVPEPELGSCASPGYPSGHSPGRCWRHWAPPRYQGEGGRPAHWAPSHCLGCSSQPPPRTYRRSLHFAPSPCLAPCTLPCRAVSPLQLAMFITIPDCRRPAFKKFWPLTFICSIVWIAVLAYFMVGTAQLIPQPRPQP